MKNSGIGGQAVLEGIMMKNQDKYSIAVRKPDNEIEVCVKEYKSLTDKCFIFKWPFIRGIFNFADSLIIGMSTLMYSSKFYDEEEENAADKKAGDKGEEKDKDKNAVKDKDAGKDKDDSLAMTGTLIFSIIFALALFVALPVVVSKFVENQCGIKSYSINSFIEGCVRLLVFLIYIILISFMNDIQRTFMYHGAEHKCINCIEHGNELNVENVLKSSRLHKRCGTSFLFLVMAISIIVFMLVPVQNPLLRIGVRIIMIPVIAGLSYEVLRFAGRHEGVFVNIISAPGMALQKLTTKEPDAEMAKVAIEAVEAVFDWREFLEKYNDKK